MYLNTLNYNNAFSEVKVLNGCVSVRYSEYGSDTLGHDYWVVKTGFTYQVDRDTHVYVPEGFLTDGASVPNW